VTLSWVVSALVAFQRWCVLSRPYTSCKNPSWAGSLPSSTGGVAWKPPFFIYYYSLRCRDSRLEASTPLLCRLLLCCLLHGYPYPWVSGGDTSLACQTLRGPLLCWAWATPEAGQRPRPWTSKTLLLALEYFLVDSSLGVLLCWLWSTPEDRTIQNIILWRHVLYISKRVVATP